VPRPRDRYELREGSGGRQKKLAQKTGLNQSESSTFESGQANPTYRTLQTLAAALGGKIELVIG
jgi:transcriptional regulator with XRE-family HTH domain